MESLSPLDFFKLECSNDDALIRTDAMQRVAVIASLLSPDKVRNELIPYLITKMNELDQILLELSSKMRHLVPYIGGIEQLSVMVPLIEQMFSVEETTVRNCACNSVNIILAQLNSAQHSMVVNHFVEMGKRILSIEDGETFYGKVSLVQIMAELFRLADVDNKAALMEILGKLVVDESNMVRREIALQFLSICSHASFTVLSNEILELYKVLLHDENLAIKVIVVDSLSSFTQLLQSKPEAQGNNVLKDSILPLVTEAWSDSSWRIRLSTAKYLSKIISCFKGDTAVDIFRTGYLKLLIDVEADVRSTALSAITSVVSILTPEVFLVEAIGTLNKLVDDPFLNVRKALADVSMDIAIISGPQLVAQHLTDVVLKLSSDEESLVKLRIIKKIDTICDELPSLCTRLTDILRAAYADSNWRVRKAIATVTPSIVKGMGHEYFKDNFVAPLLQLLKDGVNEVRIAAATAVGKIIPMTELSWAFDNLLPPIKSMASDEYLVRVSMLTAIENVLSNTSSVPEKVQSDMVTLAIGASRDKVPNVRIRATQALGTICTYINAETVKNNIRPVLFELQSDKDRDVQHFAKESFKKCP